MKNAEAQVKWNVAHIYKNQNQNHIAVFSYKCLCCMCVCVCAHCVCFFSSSKVVARNKIDCTAVLSKSFNLVALNLSFNSVWLGIECAFRLVLLLISKKWYWQVRALVLIFFFSSHAMEMHIIFRFDFPLCWILFFSHTIYLSPSHSLTRQFVRFF